MNRHSFIKAASVFALAGLAIFQFPAQAGDSGIPAALLAECENAAQERVEKRRITGSHLPDLLPMEIPQIAANTELVFASLDAEAAKLIEQQKNLQAFQVLEVLAPVKIISLGQLVKLGE